MNGIMRIRVLLAAALLLGCLAAAVRAEDAPAAPAAPAPEAPATGASAAQTPADGASASMQVEAGDKDGDGKSHGISIVVDGGGERVEIAGKVVERVAGELEAALSDLPEDVRKDIDADDMKELRGAIRELRKLKETEDTSFSPTEELAPVLSILLLFGGPIVIVAIVSYNNRRKRQMVHETIDRVIAQGKDVPVELLEALDKPRNGKSPLARGTVNVAIGIGLGAWLYAISGIEVATLGLIPLCIGLAQLLVWKLEGKPEATA